MGRKLFTLTTIAFVVTADRSALSEVARYLPKVQVKEATRLDWLFPFLHATPETIPFDMDERFQLARAEYEYFGPSKSTTPIPLIVFVSPSNKPMGWEHWQPICRRHGFAFVGVRNAGNGVALDLRIRYVLEALGDVRRRIRVDPDRTYISGFSGGGQVACLVGFNAPEYFGGVIPLGSQPIFPSESSYLSRVAERLSVATIYGAREPFAPVEKLVSRPEFQAAAVRYASHSEKGLGHAMPPSRLLERAVVWIESDVGRRKAVAERFPASRISDEPSRSEWASRVLKDARLRLKDESTIHLGIEQLHMLVQRWKEVPATSEANKLLQSYDESFAKQMRLQEREQRIQRVRATGFGQLALDKKRQLTSTQRIDYARLSLSLVKNLGEQEEVFSEHQLEQLREVSSLTAQARKQLIPLDTAVFELAGKMNQWEALTAFTATLQRLGYDVDMAPAVLEQEEKLRGQIQDFQLHAVSFKTLSGQLLDPLELRLKNSGRKIRIIAKRSR